VMSARLCAMDAVAPCSLVAVITRAFAQLATAAPITTDAEPGIASFPARSAFTGVGPAMTVMEDVVDHPAPRRGHW